MKRFFASLYYLMYTVGTTLLVWVVLVLCWTVMLLCLLLGVTEAKRKKRPADRDYGINLDGDLRELTE